MVLAEAVTHKGFENPLRLNLSNPVDSDKSGEHEICSSIHDRFRCAYVASVGRFAPALSDQTNAAISRRYDCDRRRFASRHAQEGAGQRAKVGAKKLSNTGVPPVRPGRSCPRFRFCRIRLSQIRTDLHSERRGRESNPRIAVLQTATLPLGYPARLRDRN